jgi:hypothetical protein
MMELFKSDLNPLYPCVGKKPNEVFSEKEIWRGEYSISGGLPDRREGSHLFFSYFSIDHLRCQPTDSHVKQSIKLI